MEIPLVYISDDNYSMPTAVSIASLIKNKHRDSTYRIYILADRISDKNKGLLKSLQTKGVKIEIMPMESNDVLKMGRSNIPASIHVTEAALYKFLIPELFGEYSKILYLDGDTLILSDLNEIFQIDIRDRYAAVVKDMKPMVTYQPNQNEKLNVCHQAYFNTGMMLFNLDKCRADRIVSKLIEYRSKGINYFMDQDAFNVVLDEQVEYVPYKYNMIFSNYEYYSFESLAKYYGLTEKDRKSFLESVIVLHLSSKEKPWLYFDTDFSSEWDYYYSISPYSQIPLKRESIKVLNRSIVELQRALNASEWELNCIKQSFSFRLGRFFTYLPRLLIAKNREYHKKHIHFNKDGLNTVDRKPRVIVSLTTFPERIDIVPITIQSLFNQTLKPDMIILYLSKQQFPNGHSSKLLNDAVKYGLIVKYVDGDLKPHKKYYYAIQEFPDDIIVTVDDDVRYNPKLIERLYKSYLHHPHCVSACRVHKIKFDSDEKIKPYSQWQKNYSEKIGVESFKLIATGVGGVLYPPGSLPKEAFNEQLITKTCLLADDLWLKIMEVYNGTKVVLASVDSNLDIIEDSQTSSLWKTNVNEDQNDVQLNNILQNVNWGNIVLSSMVSDSSVEFTKCDRYNPKIDYSWVITPEYDLKTYINMIGLIKDKIILVITVKDSANKFWGKLQNLAPFDILKKPEYREAYSAVIDFSNKVVIEDKDMVSTGVKYTLDNMKFFAYSSGYKEHNLSYVQVTHNGLCDMYCFDDNHNNRGIHLLVYSKVESRVVDFIRVDLHGDSRLIVCRGY